MAIEVQAFYHPLPVFGVKLSNQWQQFRADFDALAPLVRAAYVEIAATTGSHDLAGFAHGELDFRNRWRTFYDKTANKFIIQHNTGTEKTPVWADAIDFADGTALGTLGTLVATQKIESAGFYITGGGEVASLANPKVNDMLIFDGSDYREMRFNPDQFYTGTGGDGKLILSLK